MERSFSGRCFWPDLKYPHTSPPHVVPYPSHRLSPGLQYEINIGPAGNERSPQEIAEGEKVEEETKEKQQKEP